MKKKKPLFYYELNAEASKLGLTNKEMAKIAAMSESSYSQKKNGHKPWLLCECKAYCERFNRSIYGLFVAE